MLTPMRLRLAQEREKGYLEKVLLQEKSILE